MRRMTVMNRTALRRTLVRLSFIPAVLAVLLLTGCPEPIDDALVTAVEDEISPVITVESPVDNGYYYSTVTFEGTVIDYATETAMNRGVGDGSIKSIGFEVVGDSARIGQLLIGRDGSQTQVYEGYPVNYDPETELFDFSFSSVLPNLRQGITMVDITVVDGNNNESVKRITLYENEGISITISEPGDTVPALFKKGISQINLLGSISDSILRNDTADELKILKWQNVVNGWEGTLDLTNPAHYDEATSTYRQVNNMGLLTAYDFIYDPATREFETTFDIPWNVGSHIPIDVLATDFNNHTTKETVTLYLDEAGPQINIVSPSTDLASRTYYSSVPGIFQAQTVTGFVTDWATVTYLAYQVIGLGVNSGVVEIFNGSDPSAYFPASGDFTFDLDDTDANLTGKSGDMTVTVIAKNFEDLSSRPTFKLYEDSAAPAILVTISSNNAHSAYAKEGDTITLLMNVTDTASGLNGKPDVNLLGSSVAEADVTSVTADSWQVAYTLLSTDSQGVVSFEVAATDNIGNIDTKIAPTTGDNVKYYYGDYTIQDWIFTNTTTGSNNWIKANETLQVEFDSTRDLSGEPVLTVAGKVANFISQTGSRYTYEVNFTTTDVETGTDITYSISGNDMAGNNVLVPVVLSGIVFDKTSPSNQDTVFATSADVKGAASVDIASSGTATNTVWFAPVGTTIFTAGGTMTSAGGTATSISAPANEGVYYLYVLDAAGNASNASAASLTVDNTPPSNQDTVFAISAEVKGAASVDIVSSGTATNTVWFAPVGTTIFSAGGTMTSAGGTATSISAPANEGVYYLYVLDAAGNASNASAASLTVDNTLPSIASVSFTPSSGTLIIGDTLTMTIATTNDESGLSANAISVNTKDVTASNFQDLGDGTYTVDYIIASGDTDIASNDTIDLSIILEDPAGNTNVAFTNSPNSANTPTIDANIALATGVSYDAGITDADFTDNKVTWIDAATDEAELTAYYVLVGKTGTTVDNVFNLFSSGALDTLVTNNQAMIITADDATDQGSPGVTFSTSLTMYALDGATDLDTGASPLLTAGEAEIFVVTVDTNGNRGVATTSATLNSLFTTSALRRAPAGASDTGLFATVRDLFSNPTRSSRASTGSGSAAGASLTEPADAATGTAATASGITRVASAQSAAAVPSLKNDPHKGANTAAANLTTVNSSFLNRLARAGREGQNPAAGASPSRAAESSETAVNTDGDSAGDAEEALSDEADKAHSAVGNEAAAGASPEPAGHFTAAEALAVSGTSPDSQNRRPLGLFPLMMMLIFLTGAAAGVVRFAGRYRKRG